MKEYLTPRERMEIMILEEEPYNWKKHALFDLPEYFYFLLKIVTIFVVGAVMLETVIITSIATALSVDEEFVQLFKDSYAE